MKTTPTKVTTSNAKEVWNNFYGKYQPEKKKKPAFTVGDKVRLNKKFGPFKKGYLCKNNQSLHVLAIPPTDLSTARYRYIKVAAKTSNITHIYAYVDRQSDLIDLTRCFVKLNVGFKTTGNANLTSCADAVATMLTLANNIAQTLL